MRTLISAPYLDKLGQSIWIDNIETMHQTSKLGLTNIIINFSLYRFYIN